MDATLCDLSKLTDVVTNEIVKKTEYDELIRKCNAIQTINTGNLVKKANYNTKINEIEKKTSDHDHGEYITTQGFIRLRKDNFTASLKQAKLAGKNNNSDSVKKKNFFDIKLINTNQKFTSNKKHALVQNKTIKITNIWLKSFIDQSYLFNDGSQNF